LSWEQRTHMLSTSQESKERIKNYILTVFDLSSPIEKTKALWFYRDIITHIQNRVILDQFLQEASSMFGTQYEVLVSEFKKYLKQQHHYKKNTHNEHVSASPSIISKEWLCSSLFVDEYLLKLFLQHSALISDRISFLSSLANILPTTLIGKTLLNNLSEQEHSELLSYHLRREQQRETTMSEEQKRSIVARIMIPTIQTQIQHIGKLSEIDDKHKQTIISQRSHLKAKSIQ
jgi:hypothetical protein